MKNDIIIFGSCDWGTNWQTQQRLATSLSKDARVLFIENTGVRSFKVKDFNRVKQRINNWVNSDYGFNQINDNLNIFHPIFLPFQYSKIFTKINELIMGRMLNSWLKTYKFNSPIVISFLATPLVQEIIDKIYSSSVIYYCANDNSAKHLGDSKFEQNEIIFEKKVDAVFVTSEKLKERALSNNKRVFKFSSAVELSKINKNFDNEDLDIDKINKPIVGFVGSITNNLDQDLIFQACTKNKDINFVFIGSDKEFGQDIDQIKKLKNCFFLGKKNHDQIFKYINRFDLGIIPYKINQFTNAVYPAKLNEYLAMGVPVLSTNIFEIKKYNEENDNVVFVSKDKNDFSEKIQKIVTSQIEIKKEKILSAANKNSWENRYKELSKVLNEINIDGIGNKENFNQKFKLRVSQAKKQLYKKVILLSLILFVIFITPIPSYFDKYLLSKDLLNKNINSKNLIILNGYGSSKYENNQIQNILLNSSAYTTDEKYEKIFLSGRKNFISELTFLKNMIFSLNNKKILILDDNYSSLYENINFINSKLKFLGIKEIDIYINRYSRKRVEIMFNKINFDMKINFLDDHLNERSQKWFIKWTTLKAIIFEYSSILYNKFKYKI
tara:strand:+ start:2422 stop:4251 length:1830 start_codon:yes stop_codon:yes gene_type:complete